jgi:tetratricopeptide (TPR) repeat protein
MAKAARVDIFAIKEDALDGPLHAPLRPEIPPLAPGKRYIFETVVRTVGIGHLLTQGTSDSNELWLEVTVRSGERIIGRSGSLDERGEVDPWAYFLNAYMLDKNGRRIERRNAQDIFVTLYNHQIPPGAAAVVHYALTVPEDIDGPIRIEVSLRYRKFDSRFLSHVRGENYVGNDLPITTLAHDEVTLATTVAPLSSRQSSSIPLWERWNDYGIALLGEGNQGANKGELRGAAEAFGQVEALRRADGPLNLARVYYKEGRIAEAATALHRATKFDPPAPPWTVAWFSALIHREQGQLDAALDTLKALVAGFPSAHRRGFDFRRDYRMLNELGRTLFERSRQERGPSKRQSRDALLVRSLKTFLKVLKADPENATAHFNLALVYTELGQDGRAEEHRALHDKYRSDDQAVERAVALHRAANPAANHAAEPVAIYDLQRDESAPDAEPGSGKTVADL